MRLSKWASSVLATPYFFSLLLSFLGFHEALAISTSWTGTTSTSWGTASNWTAGVPTATVDAIIGDASFTGPNQPRLSSRNSYCKSLTIGTGSIVSTLSLSTNNRNITVSGDINIGANGSILQSANSRITLTGSWTKTGTYTASSNNASVIFSGGATQAINSATTFRRLTISSGSTTTLNAAITVRTFSVSGTFDPNGPTTYLVTITNSFTINANGTVKVKASTFAGNYSINPTTLNGLSIVDYAASTISQTVAALSYGTLNISGGTVKTVAGNFNVQTGGAGRGNININSGTLDLLNYTVNRAGTGSGSFTIANACTLKLQGSFPINFSTYALAPTSLVEYYGGNQTVSAKTYGHLVLSSSSGTVTKTMPTTAFIVAGNLTSSASAGTLSFTAGNAISVAGNVTLGTSTTFNGSSFSHAFAGNLTNNGTLTGSTSTITMSGLNASISGTGTFNFNNLTLTNSGINIASSVNINISGNLATTGAGTLTHLTGGTGTVTMTGATKTISGLGFNLVNLTIANTSSTISTSSDLILNGNLTVNASGNFTCNAGTVTMKGTSKTISNSGTLILFSLNTFTGSSISTTSNFSIKGNLTVQGSLTATAGTFSFTGNSILNGAPNLFNVTLNGTKLQLGAGSILGIAGALTLTAGTFDVSTNTPNTVEYNGSGAQNITGTSYYRLKLSTGGTKTASGAITVNESLYIGTSVTFSGSTFTHSIYSDWNNSGSFTAGSSTVQFLGSVDSYITGATTFNIITLNKNFSTLLLSLNNNVSVATINMTSGEVRTGSNTITITTTRTGNGIILGTITRTHTFTNGVSYAFESPNNTILFSSVSSVTTVTVTINSGAITDFPFLAAVLNKEYVVNIPSGTYNATLRLHYQDTELNGNNETNLTLWKYSSGAWGNAGKTGNDVTNNWVELSGQTNLNFRWTICDGNFSIIRWTGAVNTDWTNAGNWATVQGTPNAPPISTDFVNIGDVAFTNQPNISTSVSIRGLQFYSTTPTTLSVSSGGSLSTTGSISGIWSSNATHTINANANSLNIGGDLELGDGTANHLINLNISTGSVTVGNNLVQKSNSSIIFTGAGNLAIGANYTYTSGTFTPNNSTVTYNGSTVQTIAPLTYYNLNINKASATAIVSSPIIVNGSLSINTGGQLDAIANLTVAGDVSIGTGTILNGESATIKVGGNWTKSGTFIPASGTVEFNGSGTQNINAGNFNNLTINKASGNAVLTGNLLIDSDLNLNSGTLDLDTYSLNRTALGGTITLSTGTLLKIGGTSNLPTNFNTENVATTSTVEYNATSAQNVGTFGYGNLVISNGGSTAKSVAGSITINGDLTINNGSTLDGNANLITLQGNWSNAGTFVPSTGTVIMNGASKTISGTKNTFYDLTMTGSYSTLSGSITYVTGTFTNTGTFTQGSDSIYFYGNLLNIGTINLNGVTTVMGTSAQTITNNGTFVSGLTGVVNYNGTISPQIFSTGNAQYATVNVNNTAGVTPIQPWLVVVALNVGPGASFIGNGLSHTIMGSVNNQGTITNDGGTFTFTSSSAKTLNFGTDFSCSGIVNFANTGLLTISGSGTLDLGAVNITNTNASGITPSSDWQLSSRLFVGPGATFNGGANHTLTMQNNINVSGTFNGGTSTVIMADTAAINGIGDLNFHNLTIESLDSLGTEIDVSGNFINNGQFNPNGFGVTFTGTGTSNISGTTEPIPFSYLTISKNADTTKLSADISIAYDLEISNNAILKGGAQEIDIKANWINDGTFVPNTSTVIFSDTTADQQIQGTSTCNFYNLNITNVGFEVSLANNIAVANTLTLGANSKMNATGYELTFLSTATGTGSLAVVPTTATYTGNIRMQRYLPQVNGRYWYHMASPVNNATAAMWQSGAPNTGFYITGPFSGSNNPGNGINANSNSAFSWNAAEGIWNRFPANDNTEAIVTKKGYRVFIRDGNAAYNSGITTSKTFSTFGTPNIGNQTFTLSYHPNGGSPAGGWNLLGNPYPSNINGDLNNSAWTTKTNLDGNAIYMWNSSTNSYVSCNGGVGSCIVPSSQAFWVKVHPGGGTLVASENVKSSGSLPFYKVAAPNFLPIILLNKDNHFEDITYVRFEYDAKNGFDNQYDAYKLSVAANGISNQYVQISTTIDTLELSIDARPYPTVNDVIHLKTLGNTGNYSLDFSDRTTLDPNINIYLKDNFNGKLVDLQKSPIYAFNIASTDSSTFGERFDLLFKSDELVTNNGTNYAISISENPVTIFPNPILDNFFSIETRITMENPKIIILDMAGKEIFKKSISGQTQKIPVELNKNLQAGTYILKIISGENERKIPIVLK